jgi:hypothetical protein
MALTQRNHNPFAKNEDFLYMIIDKTTLENIAVVKLGTMRRVQLLGALLAAEGKVVIGPPAQARGFTKLSEQEMQYLYWNTTKQSPEGLAYGELVQNMLAVINQMTPNDDHIPSLEYLVSQLEPGVVKMEGDSETAEPKAAVRPKATTTTGIIWAICDEVLEELASSNVPTSPEGWKPLRAEAWARCDKEGFNSGTFGVQYGKWKGNKTA